MTSRKPKEECEELYGCTGGDCSSCTFKKVGAAPVSRSHYFRGYNQEHKEARKKSRDAWESKNKEERAAYKKRWRAEKKRREAERGDE